MSNWYRNNEAIDTVPIGDRAVHYGDGLFETIAIRAGEPRLWRLHMQRLQQGCARLDLPAPEESTLRASLAHAIRASGVDSDYAKAKLIVSAGVGPPTYRRPATIPGSPLIGIFSTTALADEQYVNGVRVRQCNTTLADQPLLAGLKTLNRLEQVMGRNEWQDPDIFEGLMCDSEEHIICGTMSNVFVIRNQSISTPVVSRSGVAGVMRRHVIDSLREYGIAVNEHELPRQAVLDADALFLSNSQFGVLPVRGFDARRFAASKLIREVGAIVRSSGVAEPGR